MPIGTAAYLASTILPALIGALGSGFSSGKKTAEELKAQKELAEQQYDIWGRKMKDRLSMIETSPLKPVLPRYSIEQNLPQFADALGKIIMGLQKDSFGNSGFGIDFSGLLSSLTNKNDEQLKPPSTGPDPWSIYSNPPQINYRSQNLFGPEAQAYLAQLGQAQAQQPPPYQPKVSMGLPQGYPQI